MVYDSSMSYNTKYYIANQALQKSDDSTDRIVFIGDSITEFWVTHNPLFFSSNSYINRGISGETTSQILKRFIPDVIDLRPKAVVLLAGINDIAENNGPISIEAIFENIKSMIGMAQENDIKVYLCSVLPANRFYWNLKISPANQVVQLNKLLHSYAKDNALTYVDYYNRMVDDQKGLLSSYGSDGVHPNRDGYAVMQSVISSFL